MRNGFVAALLIWLCAGSPLQAQSPAPFLTWPPEDAPEPHGPGPGDIDKTPHGHCVYGEVSYLQAWVKNRTAPPLLTSGPNLLLHNLDDILMGELDEFTDALQDDEKRKRLDDAA